MAADVSRLCFDDRIEELLDAAGAESLLVVETETRLMIGREVGVVGVEGEADLRVVELRHLIERDHAGPVERARRAVDREGAVAGLADWHQAGTEEADISGDVGIDEVLGRRLVEAERVEKLAPVSRRVDTQEGFRSRVAIAKSGEGEGDDLARRGDARGVGADVGEHRAVAG